MVMPIIIARMLGPEGFHDYIVVVSMIFLLATFCELGTGKYALKVIPEYYQKKDWSHARGYWRFSVAITFLISVVTAGVVVGIEWGHDKEFGDYLLGIAVLFLPPTVLTAVVAEFVIANRATIRGTLVTKIVCPVTTLVLLVLAYWIRGKADAATAILSFGFSGVIGLLIALFWFYRSSPKELNSTKPERFPSKWIRHCTWFLVIAFVMSWLSEISLIMMELAGLESIEIARFGAALKTGSIILLVAKSTNKFYSPILSDIMSQDDWARGLKIRKKRLWFIGSISASFVVLMVLFGRQVLLLYGPEYQDGHTCLILVSVGASIFTTFSMAPEFLKFSSQFTRVLTYQIIAGISIASLTWWLGRAYGANGAGAAYCISLIGMSLAFLSLTNQRLKEVLVSQTTNDH